MRFLFLSKFLESMSRSKILFARNLASTIFSGKLVFVRIYIFLSQSALTGGLHAALNKSSLHINASTIISWLRIWRMKTMTKAYKKQSSGRCQTYLSISCLQIPPPAAQLLRRRILICMTSFDNIGDLPTLRFSFQHCNGLCSYHISHSYIFFVYVYFINVVKNPIRVHSW